MVVTQIQCCVDEVGILKNQTKNKSPKANRKSSSNYFLMWFPVNVGEMCVYGVTILLSKWDEQYLVPTCTTLEIRHTVISMPNFKRSTICTLDISKIIFIKKIISYKELYSANVELCYIDTESLTYKIATEDIYEDRKQGVHGSNISD